MFKENDLYTVEQDNSWFCVENQTKEMCPIHGEYESKEVILAGRKIKTGCPICLELEIETTKQHKKKELYESLFKKSGFGNNFKNKFFDDFKCDKSPDIQTLYLNKAKEYVEQFKERKKDGKGLLLRGSVGTGKTYLTAIIANQLMLKGQRVGYVTAPELFRMRDFKETEQWFHWLKSCDLLIIDEVGNQLGLMNQNMREMSILFEIINDRHNNKRPFFIISNLTKDEDLINIVGNPTFDRIQDTCLFLERFSQWSSYRGYTSL
jgi:DNA replication protein DnaC